MRIGIQSRMYTQPIFPDLRSSDYWMFARLGTEAGTEKNTLRKREKIFEPFSMQICFSKLKYKMKSCKNNIILGSLRKSSSYMQTI